MWRYGAHSCVPVVGVSGLTIGTVVEIENAAGRLGGSFRP
jgi:hypothetical protein